MTSDLTLVEALRTFDAAEANLVRLERLERELADATPEGIVFGSDAEYEQNLRAYADILEALPEIDGWKPTEVPRELDTIGQARFDAAELGEPHVHLSAERWIEEPGRELREYRHRFDRKRRELVRAAVQECVHQVDETIRELSGLLESDLEDTEPVPRQDEWAALEELVTQIDQLLGSSVPRPTRWEDLRRHLSFAQVQDLRDIVQLDWPLIRSELSRAVYGPDDPVPVGVSDLGNLVRQEPEGPIPTKFRWDRLDDEGFERLMFALFSAESTYERVEWLTQTRAPDRGRDLSAFRIRSDPLGETDRQRVVVQCRHSLGRSISDSDVALLKTQMKHWEPPRVDVLIIATSGRFTSDAVDSIERQNASDSALMIEMWPESHLERLLASRPGLIGGLGLR